MHVLLTRLYEDSLQTGHILQKHGIKTSI
ncbi:MAG: hypothetical protein JWM96_176, partial [Alphaproteobacteria bacterium]|nr:hypothetical protein [Alphaproteobacteria bacterium]